MPLVKISMFSHLPSAGDDPLTWRKQRGVEQPTKPNRRRQKQAKRQSDRPPHGATQYPLPQPIHGEGRERRDLYGERNRLPIEPGTGDGRELDIPQADALAATNAPIANTYGQEDGGQKGAEEGGESYPFDRAR